MRRIAPPGHHVQNGRLHPAEATVIVDSDRLKNLYSEGGGPTCCAVAEYPLILETAPAFDTFEGGDAHDEVIDKLNGDGEEASVDVGVPLGVDDKVFFGGLDVVGVEDDLAEMDIGDLDVVVEGDVPLVVGLVYDLGVDVELHWH